MTKKLRFVTSINFVCGIVYSMLTEELGIVKGALVSIPFLVLVAFAEWRLERELKDFNKG